MNRHHMDIVSHRLNLPRGRFSEKQDTCFVFGFTLIILFLYFSSFGSVQQFNFFFGGGGYRLQSVNLSDLVSNLVFYFLSTFVFYFLSLSSPTLYPILSNTFFKNVLPLFYPTFSLIQFPTFPPLVSQISLPELIFHVFHSPPPQIPKPKYFFKIQLLKKYQLYLIYYSLLLIIVLITRLYSHYKF